MRRFFQVPTTSVLADNFKKSSLNTLYLEARLTEVDLRGGGSNNMSHSFTMFTAFYMGRDMRKPVFGGLRTTKAQTSLRIREG